MRVGRRLVWQYLQRGVDSRAAETEIKNACSRGSDARGWGSDLPAFFGVMDAANVDAQRLNFGARA